MLLLVDNYDSFTYNLYQYLCELGATVEVVHHDQITVDEALERAPQAIVISPGPGTPDQAGISLELIRRAAGRPGACRCSGCASATSRSPRSSAVAWCGPPG